MSRPGSEFIGEKVIMSGMFYSLEEAAQKLKKSKDEVKKLVKDGKLREFRDGPNVLFKVTEIEALMPDVEIPGPSESQEPVEEEMEIPELAEEPSAEAIVEDAIAEEPLELEPEPEVIPAEPGEFQDFDSETAISEIPEEASEPQAEEPVKLEDEDLDNILLAPETGVPAADGDLTDGDTALTGQGTSILGLSDNKEYDLTDDTMAETVIVDGTKGGSTGEGLDEIEEDVSLDSFGSGSGLLDLSLQADDTSLGGILDEIYTDENKEPASLAEPGPSADMAEEHGEMIPEEVSLAPQIIGDASLAIGPVAAQVPPDSQSNILGILLFIPIAAVLYTAIVAFSGLHGMLPSILTVIQIWVWPIMGALGLVSLIVVVAAVMLTGERSAPVAKEKKVKKVKPPKVKKEKIKKPKKEKPPKPAKKSKKSK
jgi:excisionase family DNA binding protein